MNKKMEFFETRVPCEAVLNSMDQNENEGKEYSNQKGNPFQSGPSARKKSDFRPSVSLGGDSGDRVESVAMDLISRQSEYPDDRHDSHHHHQHNT